MCGGGRVGVWLGGRSGARSSGEPERTVPRASAVGVASLSGTFGVVRQVSAVLRKYFTKCINAPRVGALAPQNETRKPRARATAHTPTRDATATRHPTAPSGGRAHPHTRSRNSHAIGDAPPDAGGGARRTPETPQKQNSNILSVYVQCTASYTSTHMLPRDLTDTSPS